MKIQELWPNISAKTQREFETQAVAFHYKRGETVYSQGDSPNGVYFVERGLIGLIKIGSTGKEHLLRFFKQGQFFGHRSLFAEEDYHGTTTVLEATDLKLIPKELILREMKESPELILPIARVLSKELGRCESQRVMILDHQIPVRVAQSLVYLKDLHPEHNWTRQEIANFCASTVSTVIKCLSDLEARNLILQKGRSISILNRDKLIALEDESF